MKLYTYFQSSAAYRVRIALNLKGLRTEMVFVNLLKGEQQSAKYEAVNPQKAVPTFVDGSHRFYQSLAIMEYLEEAYPSPALMPRDHFARAYIRALSQVIVCDTAPMATIKMRKYLGEKMNETKEDVTKWVQHWIGEGLASFERTLTRETHMGMFCYRDTPTLADCCLIPQLFAAQRWGCSLSAYPRIMSVAEACAKNPAFIAAHPAKQPDAA